MFGQLKRLFSRKRGPTEAEVEAFGNAKAAGLEKLLGPSAEFVYHAIIPYAVGGPVDVYLYPEAPHGTALATQELIEPDGTGPQPTSLGTYELVMFTRHPVGEGPSAPGTAPEEQGEHVSTPFEDAVLHARSIMTGIARYSTEAKLEPGQTAEIPGDEDGAPPTCLLFAPYPEGGRPLEISGGKHGLLCIVSVHARELAYAREHGSAALVAKLEQAGHWPRFDLDRPSVV
jgi:hypothetical protein